MPYIIIDKDDNIIEVVATIEEASARLKEHPGSKCEQLIPIEKFSEEDD